MSKDKLFIPKTMLMVIIITSIGIALWAVCYSLSLKKPSPIDVTATLTQTPNTISAPTPDDVPVPTSAPNETADWNVYRNEKYGYEVKYPYEWQGGEESSVAQVASFTPEKKDVAQTGFWVYVYENQKNLSAKDWWIKEYEKGSAKYSYKGAIQFFGINMEVYEEEDGLEFTYYIFSKNSNVYLITSLVIEEKMHQILSTFKFAK
ncbi:MAG: hypothetical protein P1P85_02835 [Patescibacteria group bacterium]|nr:hypothetical protein [Patescibacteria group bacterium]